jgi:hypothetical protein
MVEQFRLARLWLVRLKLARQPLLPLSVPSFPHRHRGFSGFRRILLRISDLKLDHESVETIRSSWVK